MKRVIFSLILLAFGLNFWSCNRSEIEVLDQAKSRVGLSVSQLGFDLTAEGQSEQLAASSRATETAFQEGDSIGLYIHQSSAVGATGNHSSNVCYSLRAGVWSASDALSDELKTTETYYVTAYYPQKKTLVNPTVVSHTVAEDQSSPYVSAKASALELSDLMMTSAPQKITDLASEPKVSLTFKHLLNKFAVKFTVPTALDGALVKGVKSVTYKSVARTCSANLASGVVGSASNQGDVKPRLVVGDGAAGSMVTYEAILAPQQIVGNSRTDVLVDIVCEMADGVLRTISYTVPATQTLSLKSGEKFTLTLSSIAEVAFLNELDLLDGLAKTDLQLKIKAPASAAWTLSSPVDWLTLSLTAGGTYSASIAGTGVGSEQIVYVKVLANNSQTGTVWTPRQAKITLGANNASAYYTAVQNYYRFSPSTSAVSLSAAQQTSVVAGFVANQQWNASTTSTWLKLASSGTYGEGSPAQTFGPVVGSLLANKMYYQAPANNSAALRTTTVVYTSTTAGSPSVSVTVNQAAPSITLNKTELSVGKDAATNVDLFTVTAPAGVKWKILSLTPETGKDMGLTLNLATGAEQVGTGAAVQVKGSYAVNALSTSRYTNVVVAYAAYGAAQQATFKLTQAAAGPEYITIYNLKWTKGNLVADGANSCKVGEPEDGGLYFQFGSLIGWKGGASGDGTGRPTKANGTYYVGNSFNATNEVQVYPSVFTQITNIGSSWPNQAGSNTYYFGYNTAPYQTAGTNIHGFAGFSTGLLAISGVGDPCRYYLGDTWRMPTNTEFQAMHDAATSKTYDGAWTNATSTSSYFVCKFTGGTELKFPAVGYRHPSNGSIFYVGDNGYCWSSSVYNSAAGYNLRFNSGNVNPQNADNRRNGFPVRCVQ